MQLRDRRGLALTRPVSCRAPSRRRVISCEQQRQGTGHPEHAGQKDGMLHAEVIRRDAGDERTDGQRDTGCDLKGTVAAR
jgi:hypothetical protein